MKFCVCFFEYCKFFVFLQVNQRGVLQFNQLDEAATQKMPQTKTWLPSSPSNKRSSCVKMLCVQISMQLSITLRLGCLALSSSIAPFSWIPILGDLSSLSLKQQTWCSCLALRLIPHDPFYYVWFKRMVLCFVHHASTLPAVAATTATHQTNASVCDEREQTFSSSSAAFPQSRPWTGAAVDSSHPTDCWSSHRSPPYRTLSSCDDDGDGGDDDCCCLDLHQCRLTWRYRQEKHHHHHHHLLHLPLLA